MGVRILFSSYGCSSPRTTYLHPTEKHTPMVEMPAASRTSSPSKQRVPPPLEGTEYHVVPGLEGARPCMPARRLHPRTPRQEVVGAGGDGAITVVAPLARTSPTTMLAGGLLP